MKKEPALIVGAIAAIVLAVQSVVVDHPGESWKALLPLIAAAVIRQYVTPAG